MPQDDPVHVAALPGSIRRGSATRRALEVALQAAEDAGATTDLVDLRALDLPIFSTERDDHPGVRELRERTGAADSILLGTPLYHGSYSSVLKTALDFCGFDEFSDKTVGLLAVAGGRFPVTALDHLRSVCRALNAWVLPHEAAVPRSHAAFEDGNLVDPELVRRVRTLGVRAVQYARIEPEPSTLESRENVGGAGR